MFYEIDTSGHFHKTYFGKVNALAEQPKSKLKAICQ
jgi:hypothetical protein